MVISSAHLNKQSPLSLQSFNEANFSGNITAYKTPWTKEKPEFPISSARDLGISEEAFKALEILFPYLDKVFRATGANFIPQRHSTVANHLTGLENLCKEVFSDKVKSKVPAESHLEFDEISKRVRLSLMLHDLPEIPGEISTFCQRLPENDSSGANTEDKRRLLENEIAEKLIYHSLKAAYAGQDTLPKRVDEAILKSQELTSAANDSAVERFDIVQKFNAEINIDKTLETSDAFNHDYDQLKQAYLLSEGENQLSEEDTRIRHTIKALDKLESKLHCAVVGDYSLMEMPPEKIIKKEHEQMKAFYEASGEDKIFKHIIGKINSLYAASMRVFREWSNLAPPLQYFEDWFTNHSS
jgi:hypothetical protein